MTAIAMGNSWRLLPLHVQRPGRIVTPDLLLTGALLAGPDQAPAPIALQRLLLLPAIQLEAGAWGVAPALACVVAVERYLVPGLALACEGRVEWVFLARQALAAADLEQPVVVELDGRPRTLAPMDPPANKAVGAGIRLGPERPLAAHAALRLSATSGSMALPDTMVTVEMIG